MKREEVEKSITESLKRLYGEDKEVELLIDIGSNTWEETKESNTMKFEIELDTELVRKYAEFLGVDKERYMSKDFNKDEYILNRFKEDIEFVIDAGLNP